VGFVIFFQHMFVFLWYMISDFRRFLRFGGFQFTFRLRP
jgi:hypothetical protein